MSWQHVHDYPIDYHENAGYRVQWHYAGGTRDKIWVATNPEGKKSSHRSKDDAIHVCDVGIARRALMRDKNK